jgi:hypothetical protein
MNIYELFSRRSDSLSDLELITITNVKTRKDLSVFFNNNLTLKGGSGVYFFEHKNSVIYIGSSGKIKQDLNYIPYNTNNGIGSRLIRSNVPYSFTGDYLCFQRKVNSGNKKEIKQYDQKVKISNLKICCIVLSPFISPTYIEHFFLQKFLEETNRIPKLNNQI